MEIVENLRCADYKGFMRRLIYCVLRCSEGEPQVLDYQTQQYKLFPLLAAAYAYWFTGLRMRDTYFMLNYEIQQSNTELLPEVTTLDDCEHCGTVKQCMFYLQYG